MFNIKYKLFLTLLISIGSVVFLCFFVLRSSFDRNFVEYINEQNQQRLSELTKPLKAFYMQSGSWQALEKAPWMFHQLLRQAHTSMAENEEAKNIPDAPDFSRPEILSFAEEDEPFPLYPHPEGHRPPPGFQTEDDGRHKRMSLGGAIRPPNPYPLRYALLDSDERVLIGPDDVGTHFPHKAILDGDKVLAYLVKLPVKPVADLNKKYIQQQNETFRLAAVAVVIIAMLVSIPVAFHLMQPITQLIQGTRKLILGEYHTQITVHSRDELAVLSRHFNTLADTLKSNENSRKRWIADISHELRTPLAILKAEIEGMEDGVITVNKDSLHSLTSEINHLNELVNDLFELTLSDLGALSYHKAPCILAELLEQTVAHFKSQFEARALDLDLEIDHTMKAQALLLDQKRIKQLLENVIKNSYSYTDSGGRLLICLSKQQDQAVISFSDSKPGVSDESLTRLFESLYRQDSSRRRCKGGAGLGLSIVKNIVTAHQGTIDASHSPLGGLQLQVRLPV